MVLSVFSKKQKKQMVLNVKLNLKDNPYIERLFPRWAKRINSSIGLKGLSLEMSKLMGQKD